MKIFSNSLFHRMNCKTMCFNLGAILLGGFLLCSCSDDEKMEEPLLFVKPVAPAVNPVDGIWIEEDTDDVENGQERHLTFTATSPIGRIYIRPEVTVCK